MATTTKISHQYEKQNNTKSGQKEADVEQYHKKAGNVWEKGTVDIFAKGDPEQVNKLIRTRSRHVIKKADRLTYI